MDNFNKIISELEKGAKSFTNLKEATGLENGVLQHHINNSGKIVKKNDAVMLANHCSNCGAAKICEDECIQKILENKRKKEIVELISEGLSQSEIAEKLEITRPTVNYHVQHLRNSGLVKGSELSKNAKKHL